MLVTHYKSHLLLSTILFILCVSLLVRFLNVPLNDLHQVRNYTRTTCVITDIKLIDAEIECDEPADQYVAVVTIPCVQMFANTNYHSNLIVYRNMFEKQNAYRLNRNVKKYSYNKIFYF